jgi:hypothetical protein
LPEFWLPGIPADTPRLVRQAANLKLTLRLSIITHCYRATLPPLSTRIPGFTVNGGCHYVTT